MPQSGQTITHFTKTTTKTTLAIKTAGLGYLSLPAKKILLLVETMPDYQNVETYHIGQPQHASVGHQLWIIHYTPLELKNYGESLVARYYFLEVQVTF